MLKCLDYLKPDNCIFYMISDLRRDANSEPSLVHDFIETFAALCEEIIRIVKYSYTNRKVDTSGAS